MESPSSSKPRFDDVYVKQLFVRMQSIYGEAWSRRWPSRGLLKAAQAEWALELGAFTPSQIDHAIHHAKGEYPDRPPTLPQFSNLCAMQKRQDDTNAEDRNRLTYNPDPKQKAKGDAARKKFMDQYWATHQRPKCPQGRR